MRYINKYMTTVTTFAAVGLLAGCSASLSRVQPSAQSAYQTQSAIKRRVALGQFSMPLTRDKKTILCGRDEDVRLPNDMTYSSYIKDAFATTLDKANRFSPSIYRGVHELSAHISTAEFNSTAGKWVINGKVRVDHNRPIAIKTQTNFTVAGEAYSSCQLVASGFRNAAAHFVDKSLANPVIVKQLNR